ncbi:MAG: nuclear transport factor 2 family protein [Gammaproteobacteria bacterium]|nr:nuclear transport factor 2 family protein [Gammaproteobacteria bacterium]
MKKWHAHMRGELPGGLDELLADDCVFFSPVVFTPQDGKELTKMYLLAAGGTFSDGEADQAPGQPGSKFHYTKEILDGDHAVLEFETEIDGKYINGIDMITWNDAGRICEFKVMVRPLQAINLLHAKMKAMLEQMQG